ncbi:DUF6221 family protein [Streptomyces sp. NPDC058758]|uniref:DUF6221 family protein n=1 Tax=Streptomyces sp. NPDC058758 TaxID=3346627 RepID=UPI00367B74DE
MDDLVQFLLARLDEDAELARQAEQVGGAPSWDSAADVLLLPGLRTRRRLADQGVPDALQGAVEAHAARHDPARVLAEVEAKRRMVTEFEKEQWVMEQGHHTGWTEGGQSVRLSMIRSWAAIYADHPDYRDTWRP